MNKIKKGDMVVVIAGKNNYKNQKDKSSPKEHKVLAVDTKTGRITVEGVNLATKHQKPSQANPQGGIVHQEMPIDVSNVMLVSDGKPTRVGFRFEDGKKVRYAKKTGKTL